MTNRRKNKNKKTTSSRSVPPLLSAPDLPPGQPQGPGRKLYTTLKPGDPRLVLPQAVRRSPKSAPGAPDAGDAREWLTENLADIERRSPNHFEYYARICEYIRDLPEDDADLAVAVELLSSYDRIPGGRPDVMIDGNPEDTVDAIMEVLDDDEMRIDERDQFMASEEIPPLGESWTPDQAAPLPRESRAAFVHAMLDRARLLLIADVADR
jgi:hypothetical protein